MREQPPMRAGAPLVVCGLRKRFGLKEALRGLELSLPENAIYGFAGLNGAGKTTTIECVLGLLRYESGEITLLGRGPLEIHRSAGRIGAAFDSPCLHPHLNVGETLRWAALGARRAGPTATELEAILGLERYHSVPARKLSLGNRRRLSIAVALLGRPELVVLDEPFSGLDPGGVDDLIELIRRLHRSEGATFLLSSHQLHLLERICTHAGIIHDGRMLAEGPLRDVLGAGGNRLLVRAEPAARALDLLSHREGLGKATLGADGRIEVFLGAVEPAAVNALLVGGGLAVSELVARPRSLESRFRELIAGAS
jgi:ABC-type multidrug transport system ATPase subunit